MINISPIGRNCSQQERNEFAIYDAVILHIYILVGTQHTKEICGNIRERIWGLWT